MAKKVHGINHLRTRWFFQVLCGDFTAFFPRFGTEALQWFTCLLFVFESVPGFSKSSRQCSGGVCASSKRWVFFPFKNLTLKRFIQEYSTKAYPPAFLSVAWFILDVLLYCFVWFFNIPSGIFFPWCITAPIQEAYFFSYLLLCVVPAFEVFCVCCLWYLQLPLAPWFLIFCW